MDTPRLLLVPAVGAALFLSSLPAEAQEVRGLVAEQGSLDPVPEAVVTLFRVSEGTELIPVASTSSDAEGGFALQGDGPGRYRVQATHFDLSSPLSPEMALDAGESEEVALMIPSRLLMMAYTCPEESLEEGGAVVVGVVRDGVSELPLSGARIVARWRAEDDFQEMSAHADRRGQYLLCGIPSGGFVQFRGELLGQTGSWDEVEIPRPAMVLHDVEMTLGTTAAVRPPGQGVVQERILTEALARGLGDLRGQLLDAGSGRPISQAGVRLGEGGQQRITDEEGRFAFQSLQPGRYLLEIAHLGYSVQADEVEVPGGRDVFVRLRVSPQAVELEGIDVVVRSEVEELQRLTPFRRDIVYGEEMARAEERGATVVDVLRTASPGLQVSVIHLPSGEPVLCIRTNRRIASFQGGGGCPNPEVVVDGVRISDGPEYLLRMHSSEAESIEFLPPSQAQTLYGIGGNTANGVVVVWTRGRGPYASPLRDP
jgi:hypothetical protein